jgi:hypothetical protein
MELGQYQVTESVRERFRFENKYLARMLSLRCHPWTVRRP